MHIKSSAQDSEPSSTVRASARAHQNFHTRLFNRHLSEFIPVAIVLVVPLTVNAGFFTSLLSVITATPTELTSDDVVSHTAVDTPLLSATQHPDPKAATGGGDVFVQNGALVSTGPVGEDEIADSEYRNGEIRVYTVGEGDTLSQIAEMYGVTSNTIMWANDLRSRSDIHPGDTLVILPIVGVQHTVAKGETLNSIVKKYEADLDEVLSYNNLASASEIGVGDELMIPGGEIAAPAQTITYAEPVSRSGGGSSAGLSHPVPGATRTQGIHGYNAVDYAAAHGTPIRAAAAGEVIVSKSGGWNGGYGSYVVVRHSNGVQTLYAHNSRNAVSVGTWVAAGQTVAYMGNTGRSTGTHLHFEVRGARNPF